MNEVEQIIREHVLLNPPNNKGWESCVHVGCDHGSKGPRSGFIFNSEGVTFNCFNCSVATGIKYNESFGIPPKLRSVLTDFGMSDKNLDILSFNLFQQNASNRSSASSNVKTKIKSIDPVELPLPKDFDLLDTSGDIEVDNKIIEYLESRKINPEDHMFMVCRQASKIEFKKWENRVIVPIFHNDNIVFYQGRDISGKSAKKYMNATNKKLNRNKIISNYDILFEDYDKPLYVTEGWFDAYHLNGVALFGNHIREEQAAWLSKSSREKVYVMDRFGDGQEAALEAVEMGWSVSIPFESSFDDKIKDVNDLIDKYGRLYTLKLIQSKTYDEFSAKINIQLHTTS